MKKNKKTTRSAVTTDTRCGYLRQPPLADLTGIECEARLDGEWHRAVVFEGSEHECGVRARIYSPTGPVDLCLTWQALRTTEDKRQAFLSQLATVLLNADSPAVQDTAGRLLALLVTNRADLDVLNVDVVCDATGD